MVAVLILHQVHDLSFELVDKYVLFLVHISDVLEGLLNNPTTKSIVGKVTDTSFNELQSPLFVLIEPHFEYLLEDIISELVFNEAESIFHKLLENQLLFLVSCRLYPVLDCPGAIPISGHLVQHWDELLRIELAVLPSISIHRIVHFLRNVHHLHVRVASIVELRHRLHWNLRGSESDTTYSGYLNW